MGMNRLCTTGCAVGFVVLLPAAGARAAEDYAQGSYSKEIVLDTTDSGAAVSTDVRNAPILLRLDLGAAAMPGGSGKGATDLRFTTIDGKPLAHEIERWDARRKRAEVWVVLDTVKGGTRAQAIKMYWGSKGAAPASDGVAVFGLDKDFMAVWHLGGPAGDKADAHRDSGANAAHGTGVKLTKVSAVEGVIAGAQDFEDSHAGGKGQMIKIDPAKKPLLSVRTGMTVSTWIKIESWTRKWQTIVAKGDREWRLARADDLPGLEFCVNNFKPDCAVGKSAVADGKWHHVVGVWTGKTLDLYVDGVLDQSTPIREGAVNASDFDVLIGENSQRTGRMFDGAIDEVVILGAARDAAWVKLIYENQRPGGKLVTFGKASKLRAR